MKRRINLLSITFTKRKLSEVIGDVRSKALIALIIFVILGIGEAIGIYYLNDQLTKDRNSKTTLETYLQSNQTVDRGIKYFIYKYGLLEKYLEEDANGYFYYTKIQGIVNEFSPNGKLELFSYNNTGETTFTVEFPSYEEASVLLTAVETPEFLNNFEFVQLEGFDAAPKESQTTFVVTITAKIIKEDET